MRSLLLCLMFVAAPLPAVADVYRSVDEHGNVIFTDKASPGSKKVQVPPATTVRPFTVPTAEQKPEEQKPVSYAGVSITQPVDGQALRSNAGDVSITVAVDPYLDVTHGHAIAVVLDGVRQDQTWTSTSLTLPNLDRGTHTLQVLLVDSEGRILERSEPVTFHLKRHSILFR